MNLDDRARAAGQRVRNAAAGKGGLTAHEVARHARRRQRSRAAGAAVVMAVLAAGVVARWPSDAPDVAFSPDRGTADSLQCDYTADTAHKLQSGWQQLQQPLLPEAEAHASAALADHVVMTTFGVKPATAMLDVNSQSWSCTGGAPLSGRALTQGADVVMAGGDRNAYAWDGDHVAVFDVGTAAWSRLPDPPAPTGVRDALAATVAGPELLVWWSPTPGEGTPGAAFDTRTQKWRLLPKSSISVDSSAEAVWNGREVFLVGSSFGGSAEPKVETPLLASYDPASDQWETLAQLPLSPNAFRVESLDGGLIAVDYLLDVATYDPDSNRWQNQPGPGMQRDECGAATAIIGDDLYVKHCHGLAVRDGTTGTWQRLPDPPEPNAGGIVGVGQTLIVVAPATVNYPGSAAMLDVGKQH